MEKIYIVTDSTAGVPEEVINRGNVKVLPLTIEFEGKVYKDGVEIKEEDLLEMLDKGDKLPKTSQVNPKTFCDEFEEILSKGYKIISIHISSKLSGTYQSACIAKDMLKDEGEIHVIDSKGVSFATGALVQEAVKMLEKEEPLEVIVEKLKHLSDKVRVAFAVDDLEYIRKGGRISSVHAAVGTLLNIKPVLHMEDGKIDVFEKVRGRKKALKTLLNYVKENNPNTDLTFAIGNVAASEDMEIFKSMLKDENIKEDVQCVSVGSVIATYAGPGTVGVFFFEK